MMSKQEKYMIAVVEEIERLNGIRYPGHKCTRETILMHALTNHMNMLQDVIWKDEQKKK